MTDDNTREQTLLDQYWDADETNRRYIPDELDTSLRETVDRFHAADDAPDPDDTFVDRLWADLSGGAQAGATAAPTDMAWTDSPDDEPAEPRSVAGRTENPMQTRQQSVWRRRVQQFGELVAGVLVLALVTGALVLAYQNMIGEGEGETTGAGGETGWVEPGDDEAEEIVEEEPTPALESTTTDLPDEDPTEMTTRLFEAAEHEDLDAIRDMSVDEVAQLGDAALEDLTSRYLAPVTADYSVSDVDAWETEAHAGWAVVRHVENPAVALVFVADGEAWSYHPDPGEILFAQMLDDLGSVDGRTEVYTDLLPDDTQRTFESEPEVDAPFSVVAGPSAQFISLRDEDEPVLRFLISVPPGDVRTIDIDSATWHAGEDSGPLDVALTNAQFHDQNELAFPGRPPDAADSNEVMTPGTSTSHYWVEFDAEGLPDDVERLTVQFEDITISGFNLPGEDPVDELRISASYEYTLLTYPEEWIDDEISSSSEPAIDTDDVTVFFPRQAEQPDIVHDDVLVPGELVLDEYGCLRFDEDGPVIVWPHAGFSAQLIDDEVTVVDDQEGEAIASVGEDILLHGSPRPATGLEDSMLEAPLPDACADADDFHVTGLDISAP